MLEFDEMRDMIRCLVMITFCALSGAYWTEERQEFRKGTYHAIKSAWKMAHWLEDAIIHCRQFPPEVLAEIREELEYWGKL